MDTHWPSRCLTCGEAASPTLGSLRRGQGGYRPFGRRKAGAAIRLDAEQAAADMRAAGLVLVRARALLTGAPEVG
ncbi:hypothetical protein DQ384_36800 [Sphaerisporangium album]|uniref:Uncharacterized protein n=1 Tax=Sphaerisporangium album TaxID=509200 RepID=A0A367EVI5_9ACTN|nr:hypothetical protein [Sphaerisporangium album]RCG21170.1 hypothetical protein DQ384_36800 [Sphaerisporangium album]